MKFGRNPYTTGHQQTQSQTVEATPINKFDRTLSNDVLIVADVTVCDPNGHTSCRWPEIDSKKCLGFTLWASKPEFVRQASIT